MKNMKNTKFNTIVFGLGLLALLVLVTPTAAFAKTANKSCGEGGCNYTFETDDATRKAPKEDNGSMTVSPTPTTTTRVVYVNTGSTAKKTTATTKKATVKPAEPAPEVEGSSIAANALFGTNGFLPSGFLQWIFLAILILLIVILIRKITGAEDKYHSTPLKHA